MRLCIKIPEALFPVNHRRDPNSACAWSAGNMFQGSASGCGLQLQPPISMVPHSFQVEGGDFGNINPHDFKSRYQSQRQLPPRERNGGHGRMATGRTCLGEAQRRPSDIPSRWMLDSIQSMLCVWKRGQSGSLSGG